MWPSLGDDPDPGPVWNAPETWRGEYGAPLPPEAVRSTRLDTRGLSGQVSESTDGSPGTGGLPTSAAVRIVALTATAAWVVAVGAGTESHRARRATRFRARARRVRDRAREEGRTDREANHAAEWHLSRAKGQENRVRSTLACGKNGRTRVTHCQACNANVRAPDVCGAWLFCEPCRGRLITRRRQKIRASLDEWTFRARRMGLLNPKRRGGRWSMRMLTLTLPHNAPGCEQTIAGRVAQFRKAWTHMRRLMRVYLEHRARETRGSPAMVHWYAGFEWTPAGDRLGHPHAHVGMLSPFIVKETIVDFWRWSLEHAGIGELRKVGHRLRPIYTGDVILDIEEAYGEDPASELCKYVVKTWEDNGGRLDAELYAKAYEALDARRSYSGSPGFMTLALWAPECSCGVSGCFQVRFERTPEKDAEPHASSRGPPE